MPAGKLTIIVNNPLRIPVGKEKELWTTSVLRRPISFGALSSFGQVRIFSLISLSTGSVTAITS